MRSKVKRMVLASIITGVSCAAAAQAQKTEELVSYQVLTPELALKATQAALKACRDAGYQVAIAVVDRGGVAQTLMRDQLAGPHTPDTAIGKAWTAVSFRTNTTELARATQPGQAQSGARHIPGTIMLGGGVVIEASGAMVGAIGVSGAPTGAGDEKCAIAGIDAIREALEF
jgi:uncharacterized protein GlcG (DUF336 family)